jgi:hypothetical protein
MAFKKGDLIKQVVVVLQGEVLDVSYNADAGTFQYLMSYIAEDGTESSRWFDESQVEKV